MARTTGPHHRGRPTADTGEKSIVDSFAHALEGAVHAFKTQRHMRVHLTLIIVVLLAALFYQVSELEAVVLFFAISLVLVTELFNTAVEMTVDLVTQRYHQWAKTIKDVAAAAVLVASANAVLVATVVFLQPERWRQRLSRLAEQGWPHPPLETILVSAMGIALLAALVVALKARTRTGTFLAGGVVSGHAALAFFLATSVFFLTYDAVATALAVALALLISQSRVQGQIHTVRETVLGAGLGIAVAAATFSLAYLV